MKITHFETFVIGDGHDIDPDKGAVEPLACIKVHTDEGLTGLAEVFRIPPGVVLATVGDADSFFGRLLIGQEISHPERLWQKVWDALLHSNRRGWEVMILGALDIAIWDIYGQALNQPVWQLLGGVQRGPFQSHKETAVDHVTPYCTLVSDNWDSPEMIRDQVSRAETLAGLGYRAFKVEPMMSTPGRVIELAREARRALGPEPTLMVDVGYLFNDLATVIRIARSLAEYDIFFLETPFPVDSPELYGRLSSQSPVPIAMGEHAVTRWELLDMIDRGGVQVVQPYVNTCGGMTEAKRIAELARERGALLCPGNWSTQILGAASVHLAAYSSVTPFIEFAAAEVFDSPLRQALQDAGHPVRNGRIALPQAPGIGFQLPESIINTYGMT